MDMAPPLPPGEGRGEGKLRLRQKKMGTPGREAVHKRRSGYAGLAVIFRFYNSGNTSLD
jgi:hypothetical protein